MPTGARYWRMKYRYAGKEKRLALGVFPEVSLGDARDGADKARALLRDGVDPSAKRKADSPSAVRGPVEHPPCHRQRRLPGPDISEIPIIQLDDTKIRVAHESGAWKVRDLHPLPYMVADVVVVALTAVTLARARSGEGKPADTAMLHALLGTLGLMPTGRRAVDRLAGTKAENPFSKFATKGDAA
jgi:hypothetical protein